LFSGSLYALIIAFVGIIIFVARTAVHAQLLLLGCVTAIQQGVPHVPDALYVL
jgi:hypothetical protein